MRIVSNTWLPIISAACLFTACRSTSDRTNNTIYWVYGFKAPFIQPIKQTNFETNFFNSIDSMIQKGLRDRLRMETNVSISPVAMWTVFSYPSQTDLKFEPEVFEDVDSGRGWTLRADGVFAESNDTNAFQTVWARQKSRVNEPTATLTMLLQIEDASQTNLINGWLCCTWRHGALDNHGLRLGN
jgi:S-adenosylmethionine:tRNA-ribosyltransferase-isomerase (queuine synthetase)